MSSSASFVTVPSASVGDALSPTWLVQNISSKYRATPSSVADGQAQGILIDAFGRLIAIGAAADNAAVVGNPNLMAGIYNLASPTYDSGDVATFQMDVNGYLRVRDAGIAALSKDVGASDANTLRVQLASNSLTNLYSVNGPAADNAAATGNPLRNGGVYNLALPTYDSGDIASLQLDVNGYLRVRDQSVVDLAKDAGATGATVLRVQPTSNALTNTYTQQGTAADNAAASGNPLRTGGQYNTALPTYDNGDQTTLQVDVNGYLRVRDQSVVDLDKNVGAAGAATLRVQLANDSLTNTYTNQGTAADNAAASGNPVRVGGQYNAALPTYGSGDQVTDQHDISGRKIVTDDQVLAQLATLTTLLQVATVDFLDTPLLDASSTNIPGSASLPVQVVASLAAAVKKIQVFDTTGEFFGIYTGAAAAEVLVAVVGPGSNETVEVFIAASTRISLRSLTTTAITSGNVTMNFMG